MLKIFNYSKTFNQVGVLHGERRRNEMADRSENLFVEVYPREMSALLHTKIEEKFN